MDAPAPPPPLDYEHQRPRHYATQLERHGLRLYSAGRWCLATAVIAVTIATASIAVLLLLRAIFPTLLKSDELVMLIATSLFLSILTALITYPTGVILQTFGDAYLERADVQAHLNRDA